METGIYLRVSTEEQAQEGFSIRGQEQKLKDYAGIKDWSIYKIYADEGISGKNITERPAMNELIADIKAGHVKNVLVFKIDRLTRSTADLLYLVELFNAYDCTFNSLMESIDTQTASGRMFLKIIGIFAEFERENIVERVKLGVERKVKEGYCISSHPSYGYDKPKGQKLLTINETEASIVREVYEMYVKQGLSLTKIAKTLNLRGVRSKENASWASSQIRSILSNHTYLGKVRHHVDDKSKTYIGDGLHEAIISDELFEKAQKLLKKNAKISPTKKPKEHCFFSGFMFCSDCGSRLKTHYAYKSTTSVNYRCREKSVGLCNSNGMSQKKVELAFQNYIDRIEPFSEADKLELQQQEQTREQNQQKIQQYQDRLYQLDRKGKEILQLYISNDIDFEIYRNMKKQLDSDRQTVKAELAKLDMQAEQEPEISKEDIITELKRNWTSLTNAEKRQFLVRFVKRIVAVNEIPEGKTHGTVRIISVEFNCD